MDSDGAGCTAYAANTQWCEVAHNYADADGVDGNEACCVCKSLGKPEAVGCYKYRCSRDPVATAPMYHLEIMDLVCSCSSVCVCCSSVCICCSSVTSSVSLACVRWGFYGILGFGV